ncbi:extracellular serine/threonine protein kinase FAM20C isoform X1, partial [Arapaima gigas]
VNMILFRKFRVLILMVFLLACTLHIMIDLLPKLERRVAGVGAGGAACSCAHGPSDEAQSWGKQRLRAAAEPDWPNKHTLRILQDFSNEPGSNLTSHSVEKITGPAERAESFGKRREQYEEEADKKHLVEDARGGSSPAQAAPSRLASLFEHPLYKTKLPLLTDEDTLFNVNADIRFSPKAAEEPDW